MNILELMHSLDDAYHRFGDIKVIIHLNDPIDIFSNNLYIKTLNIDSDEFIIKCE